MCENLAETVRALLEASHLELEATVSPYNDGYLVELSGPDRELLLERNGELLSALQLIVQKMVRAENGQQATPIVLDSQGFRQSRDEELREIAVRAAQKVKRAGQMMALSPMDPYERRIIHLTLREDAGVHTQSQGDGFLKSVEIHPN